MTLRYRARSLPVTDDRGGRFALRHDATGIGGLGEAFLVLPEAPRSHRVRIEWALPAGCPATVGGAGISSFGTGTATATVDASAGLATPIRSSEETTTCSLGERPRQPLKLPDRL